MKFKPANRVTFSTADDVEFVVKPFFYTNGVVADLHCELFAEDGTRLECIDNEKGVYRLGHSEVLAYLKTNSALAT